MKVLGKGEKFEFYFEQRSQVSDHNVFKYPFNHFNLLMRPGQNKKLVISKFCSLNINTNIQSTMSP